MVNKRFVIGLLIMFIVVLVDNVEASKDLEITLAERQVSELSPDGLILTYYLKINNSSNKNYQLIEYSYRFVVEQTEFFQLSSALDEGIKLEPGESTYISLPVKITYQHLFEIIPGVDRMDKVVCYLSGELSFAERGRIRERIPVAYSGEFPIFRKPEVSLKALIVNQLTIGGADIAIQVKFLNRNGFELLVDRISYEIKLGGHSIGEGYIKGDKNLPAKGEREFSLPLLLNFFQVGKEIEGFLYQDETNCQFSGEVEVRTIWGRMILPYAINEKIKIERMN